MSMSSRIRLVGLCAGLSLLVWSQGAGVVRAEKGHEGMDHKSMGHGAVQAGTVPQGTAIRETKVDGFSLAYRLYSWDERNVMMKGMEGHVMPGYGADIPLRAKGSYAIRTKAAVGAQTITDDFTYAVK